MLLLHHTLIANGGCVKKLYRAIWLMVFRVRAMYVRDPPFSTLTVCGVPMSSSGRGWPFSPRLRVVLYKGRRWNKWSPHYIENRISLWKNFVHIEWGLQTPWCSSVLMPIIQAASFYANAKKLFRYGSMATKCDPQTFTPRNSGLWSGNTLRVRDSLDSSLSISNRNRLTPEFTSDTIWENEWR